MKSICRLELGTDSPQFYKKSEICSVETRELSAIANKSTIIKIIGVRQSIDATKKSDLKIINQISLFEAGLAQQVWLQADLYSKADHRGEFLGGGGGERGFRYHGGDEGYRAALMLASFTEE